MDKPGDQKDNIEEPKVNNNEDPIVSDSKPVEDPGKNLAIFSLVSAFLYHCLGLY